MVKYNIQLYTWESCKLNNWTLCKDIFNAPLLHGFISVQWRQGIFSCKIKHKGWYCSLFGCFPNWLQNLTNSYALHPQLSIVDFWMITKFTLRHPLVQSKHQVAIERKKLRFSNVKLFAKLALESRIKHCLNENRINSLLKSDIGACLFAKLSLESDINS